MNSVQSHRESNEHDDDDDDDDEAFTATKEKEGNYLASTGVVIISVKHTKKENKQTTNKTPFKTKLNYIYIYYNKPNDNLKKEIVGALRLAHTSKVNAPL